MEVGAGQLDLAFSTSPAKTADLLVDCLENWWRRRKPYHSKYNPIERCWAALEKHWNGSLLIDVPTALAWAKTMTWKGITPLVRLTRKAYHKAVRIRGKAQRALEARLQRHPDLRWWDIRIQPQPV